MEHAGTLDLVSFEDPVFYDKMERARRQTAARLGMLASLAGMAQQLLTLVSLLSAVLFYDPWLLIACWRGHAPRISSAKPVSPC